MRHAKQLSPRGGGTDKGPAIRSAYERYGAEAYYTRFGATYRNPHEPAIRAILGEAVARWRLDLRDVLDLACGSGEATLALRELGATRIEGLDPYTGEAYGRRTGMTARPISFEAIAGGALAGRRYSLIVCSFALHLIEPSRLPVLCYQLSSIGDALLVLTPHKRPVLREAWGWTVQGEMVRERVRARYYTSVPHHPYPYTTRDEYARHNVVPLATQVEFADNRVYTGVAVSPRAIRLSQTADLMAEDTRTPNDAARCRSSWEVTCHSSEYSPTDSWSHHASRR